LELGPTVPGETYVYLGPHSTMFEIWLSKEPERFDARIRAIVEAVKRGRYREWVRLENGRLVARGYLGLSSGTFEISHNLFLGWALRARGFEHLTYEPY
jgi:hypothetical protein